MCSRNAFSISRYPKTVRVGERRMMSNTNPSEAKAAANNSTDAPFELQNEYTLTQLTHTSHHEQVAKALHVLLLSSQACWMVYSILAAVNLAIFILRISSSSSSVIDVCLALESIVYIAILGEVAYIWFAEHKGNCRVCWDKNITGMAGMLALSTILLALTADRVESIGVIAGICVGEIIRICFFVYRIKFARSVRELRGEDVDFGNVEVTVEQRKKEEIAINDPVHEMNEEKVLQSDSVVPIVDGTNHSLKKLEDQIRQEEKKENSSEEKHI
jgi:ABC-type proline/glycine betaine transport system permease subunit